MREGDKKEKREREGREYKNAWEKAGKRKLDAEESGDLRLGSLWSEGKKGRARKERKEDIFEEELREGSTMNKKTTVTGQEDGKGYRYI